MGIIEEFIRGINKLPTIRQSLNSHLVNWDQEEDIKQKAGKLVSKAKEVVILKDNPSPALIKKIEEQIPVKTKRRLLIRKEGDQKDNSFEYQRETEYLDKQRITEGYLKNDCFIIVDKKDILWVKAKDNKAEFIYNAPWLARRIYSDIASLSRYKLKRA